jgi:hypothetical protein
MEETQSLRVNPPCKLLIYMALLIYGSIQGGEGNDCAIADMLILRNPEMRSQMGQILRLANKFREPQRELFAGTSGTELLTATAAAAASGAAADHVHERRVEINAAIAHVIDLLGLGECVGNVTGLAVWVCLQDERCCASYHGCAERCAPPCRIVAPRISSDHAFTWRRKSDYAGTIVGEGTSEIRVRAGADTLHSAVAGGINQSLGAVVARRGNHDDVLAKRVLHSSLQTRGGLSHTETHADDVSPVVSGVINRPDNVGKVRRAICAESFQRHDPGRGSHQVHDARSHGAMAKFS